MSKTMKIKNIAHAILDECHRCDSMGLMASDELQGLINRLSTVQLDIGPDPDIDSVFSVGSHSYTFYGDMQACTVIFRKTDGFEARYDRTSFYALLELPNSELEPMFKITLVTGMFYKNWIDRDQYMDIINRLCYYLSVDDLSELINTLLIMVSSFGLTTTLEGDRLSLTKSGFACNNAEESLYEEFASKSLRHPGLCVELISKLFG